MTIKELKEILIHFNGKEYEDYNIILWDFENQRELKPLSGCHASDKVNKTLCFPVSVPPVDGKHIFDKIKELVNNVNDGKDKENI